MFGCTPPPVNALTTRMSPYVSGVLSVSTQGVPGNWKLMFLVGSVGFSRQLSAPGFAAAWVASGLPALPSVVNGQPEAFAHAPSGDSAAGFCRNQNAVFSSPLLLVRSPP